MTLHDKPGQAEKNKVLQELQSHLCCKLVAQCIDTLDFVFLSLDHLFPLEAVTVWL